MNKTNIFRIGAGISILLCLGLVIFRLTRPEPTASEVMQNQPAKFTFLVGCQPTSMAIFVAGWNMDSETGGPKAPGKIPRKYAVACTVPVGSEVIPLYDIDTVKPSIPLPKAGEGHTFTLYEATILSMVDIPGSEARIRVPINSEGALIIPVKLWPWATENVLNLVCFEEISESTNQPEHACWLQ